MQCPCISDNVGTLHMRKAYVWLFYPELLLPLNVSPDVRSVHQPFYRMVLLLLYRLSTFMIQHQSNFDRKVYWSLSWQIFDSWRDNSISHWCISERCRKKVFWNNKNRRYWNCIRYTSAFRNWNRRSRKLNIIIMIAIMGMGISVMAIFSLRAMGAL